MATGIPGRKQVGGARPTSPECQLEYPGKVSVDEILQDAKSVKSSFSELTRFPAGHGDNTIYFSDNYKALCAMANDRSVAGKIRLCYIDPPFATSASYESRGQQIAYHDYLTGGGFIEFLRKRVVLIRELLAEDGSFYLHLDENMVFEAKIMLDEIFGRQGFRNMITRKKCNTKNYTKKTYGNISDYILFYSKGKDFLWNRPVDQWDNERAAKEYNCVDKNGKRYKKVPVHAPGVRNGATGCEWLGRLPPPGKHWQYTPDRLTAMDARGEIYWSPTGNPRRKVYFEQSEGIPVQDIWMDVKDAHNQNIRVTGYPTEKNYTMMRRIIEASSNPGDMVLDCFAGSGTTLDVADQLERKWIGCDVSLVSICTIVRRLIAGVERMGDFVKLRTEPTRDKAILRPIDTPHCRQGWRLLAESGVCETAEIRELAATFKSLGLEQSRVDRPALKKAATRG